MNRIRSAIITRFQTVADDALTSWIAENRHMVETAFPDLSKFCLLEHTASEGTLLYTPDRSYNEAIKAQKNIRHSRLFDWGRSLGCWYIKHSRDQAFPPYDLTVIAERLRAAHVPVLAFFTKAPKRSVEERVQDFRDRAAERAERYAQYGENAAGRSEQAFHRADQASERFSLGQPILVGHHSETSARRDQARAHAAMRKGVDEANKAAYWEGRARAAGYSAMGDATIGQTMRRIDRIEADLRAAERSLAGDVWHQPPTGEHKERIEARIEDLQEQAAYWRSTIAARGVRPMNQNDFYPGQSLGKYVVIIVSPKSVTVANPWGEYSWTKTQKMEYSRMKGTTDPERDPHEWEPYAGKHPRKTLIENIYKVADYPVKAGNMHGIVVWDWENPYGADSEFVLLEHADNEVLDRIAEHYKVSDSKPKEHENKALIKAIYSAWKSDSRQQEGGKHYVSTFYGGDLKRYCLEDSDLETLAKLARKTKLRMDGTAMSSWDIVMDVARKYPNMGSQGEYTGGRTITGIHAIQLLEAFVQAGGEPRRFTAFLEAHPRDYNDKKQRSTEEIEATIQAANALLQSPSIEILPGRWQNLQTWVDQHRGDAYAKMNFEGTKISYHMARAMLDLIEGAQEENRAKILEVSTEKFIAWVKSLISRGVI